ncbi:MAG: hypothetical protein RLZZ200_1522 [Pseudomonadota bacterium]|jgi:membrane protein implicated in regulation of membrane protease activity
MASAYWMIAGILLFAIEMAVIDAQFYLVFMGASALLVGVVEWAGLSLSGAGQWLLFAVLSLVAMLGFRKRLYTHLRTPRDPLPDASGVGERVRLPQALPPGESCRVEYRGSSWTARNVGDITLTGEVSIAHIEGLTLHVR